MANVTTQTGKITASFTGAAQRTLASKLEEAVSVRDFGAVGDGVADDRAALAAADAVGDFVVPSGDYRIASNITLANNVTLLPGAVLVPDTGVTVTFSQEIIASNTVHFDVSEGGNIAAPELTTVVANWWSDDAGGTTNFAQRWNNMRADIGPAETGTPKLTTIRAFGAYDLTEPMDCTGIRGNNAAIHLELAELHLTTVFATAAVAISFCDSRRIAVHNLNLRSPAGATVPTVGVLCGRLGAAFGVDHGRVSGEITFYNPRIVGDFTNSCLYSSRLDNSAAILGTIINYDTTSKYVVAQWKAEISGSEVPCPFLGTMATTGSASQFMWHKTSIRGYATEGVWYGNAEGMLMYGTYFRTEHATTPGPCIVIDTASGSCTSFTVLDADLEAATAPTCRLQIKGINSVSNLTWRPRTIIGAWTAEIIITGAVDVQGVDIHLKGTDQFQAVGGATLSGRIHERFGTGTNSSLRLAGSTFNGTLFLRTLTGLTRPTSGTYVIITENGVVESPVVQIQANGSFRTSSGSRIVASGTGQDLRGADNAANLLVNSDGVTLNKAQLTAANLPTTDPAAAGRVWVEVPAIALLNQTITNPPTQTEVQAISDKIDALLAILNQPTVRRSAGA